MRSFALRTLTLASWPTQVLEEDASVDHHGRRHPQDGKRERCSLRSRGVGMVHKPWERTNSETPSGGKGWEPVSIVQLCCCSKMRRYLFYMLGQLNKQKPIWPKSKDWYMHSMRAGKITLMEEKIPYVLQYLGTTGCRFNDFPNAPRCS